MTIAPQSTIGLGTAPLGGLFEPVSPQAARDTVDAAWALGVRFFDTAPLYGSGLAEERLGQALAGRPRDEYTISTKVGRVLRPGQASPHFHGAPRARADLRLQPRGHSPLARREPRAAPARRRRHRAPPRSGGPHGRGARARSRSCVSWRHVSASAPTSSATALELVERGDIDLVLLAGRYTLLDRSAGDELLPLCAERGIAVLAAGVFNSGILAGGSTFDYERRRPRSSSAAARARDDVRALRRAPRRGSDPVPARVIPRSSRSSSARARRRDRGRRAAARRAGSRRALGRARRGLRTWSP